jgi:hypothetical protein
MLTLLRLVAALATVVFLVVFLAPGAPHGQTAKALFKPEELEQIVAPIALYPDPVLAQIFMASTYPIEVVQAARLVQGKPDLKGEQLDAELKKQTWDDSVKSLTRLPQVLSMMNEKLDWTQKLGDAVLAQQKEVMDAVQRLRAKAQASGNLQSTSQQKVTVEAGEAPAASPAATAGAPPPAGSPPPPPAASAAPPAQQTVIKIEPTDPQVVYVPSYSPTVVYGAWPYPAYPPYYYYPPGYAAGAALSFTAGVVVGGALWSGCNWNRGEVDIDVDRQTNFSANVNVEQTRTNVQQARSEGQQARAEGQQARTEGRQARAEGQSGQGNRASWQHDPEHRKGVQYRDQATQQRYNRTGVPDAAGREAYRGRAEQARQDVSRSSAGGQTAPRAGGSAAGQAASRGQGGSAAFEGLGQGRSAQDSSQRGASSVSSARSGGYAGSGGARAAGGARAGGAARGGGGRR